MVKFCINVTGINKGRTEYGYMRKVKVEDIYKQEVKNLLIRFLSNYLSQFDFVLAMNDTKQIDGQKVNVRLEIKDLFDSDRFKRERTYREITNNILDVFKTIKPVEEDKKEEGNTIVITGINPLQYHVK